MPPPSCDVRKKISLKVTRHHIQLLLLQTINNKYQHKLIWKYFYTNFFAPVQIFLLKQRSDKEVVYTRFEICIRIQMKVSFFKVVVSLEHMR